MAKNEIIEDLFLLDQTPLFSHNRKKEDYLVIEAIPGQNKFNANGSIIFKAFDVDNYLYLPGSFLKCKFKLQNQDKLQI